MRDKHRRLAHNAGMDAATAWTVIVALWLAPLAHVALSPRSGPLLPPEGSRCPFGPRLGWIVIVLIGGALGWLMFWNARYRRPRTPRAT